MKPLIIEQKQICNQRNTISTHWNTHNVYRLGCSEVKKGILLISSQIKWALSVKWLFN